MEPLIEFDRWLFYLINGAGANGFFDAVMPFLTDFSNFEIPLAIAWVMLMVFGGRRGRVTALVLAVTLLMTDQMSSHVIKPLVQRERPCVELSDVRALMGLKTSFSFPSSHAANIFGAATVLSLGYRRLTIPFMVIATAVAYSRVYVGVHYPLDVIAGAALGVGFGAGASVLARRSLRRLSSRRKGGGGEADE